MSEFYGMGHDGLNVALMSAFLDALGKRRAGELGDRAQALLNSVGRSDPRGAEKLEATLEGLVRELAPWIRGEAGKEKSESPLSIVDPEAPGGVRYELDATSGPELAAVLEDLRHSERHRMRGADLPTRLMLEGPPGCGKTEAAVWLARGLGRKLAVAMLSKIISKWVGETGSRFLAAVDEARKIGAVLLVDELDALGSHRTEGGNGMAVHASQVVGAVNQVLDDRENRDLVIVGATNLPDMIDPAVARRFEARIKFGYPDAATRERIARHHWRLAPVADGVLEALVARTEGKSGHALVRAAHAANRSAERRGAAVSATLPEDPPAIAAALREIAGGGVLPAAIGARVSAALAELNEMIEETGGAPRSLVDEALAETSQRERRSDGPIAARGLVAEASRIEVCDVVAAISGLTREVPLAREPSRLVFPGSLPTGRA